MSCNTSDPQDIVKSFYSDILQDLNNIKNVQGENLLHYVCKLKEFDKIEYFLNIGCKIYEQDILGRTPLHIVIENMDKKSIQIFQSIFQKLINELEKQNLAKDLKKLFKVYDHQGYTVFHKAVKYNLVDLVQVMLKFSKKYNINVAAHEVLGNGDSVLHLAVKENLIEMAKVLTEYIPTLLYVENYTGLMPADYDNITLEMNTLLKCNIHNVRLSA